MKTFHLVKEAKIYLSIFCNKRAKRNNLVNFTK